MTPTGQCRRGWSAVVAMAALLPMIASGVITAEPGPTTGLQLAERIDHRVQGKDARLEMSVELVDRHDERRRLELLLLRRTADGADDILIRFSRPDDIAGMALLAQEPRKDREGRYFVYMPEAGRVRQVGASRRRARFAGTDFTYEDIAGAQVEDFTYELLDGEPELDGRPVDLLELRPKARGGGYDRKLWWIDRDRLLVLQAEFYRRDTLLKRYRGSRAERIDGVWTLRTMEMQDFKKKHRTKIEVTRVNYNVGLAPSDVSPSALTPPVNRGLPQENDRDPDQVD
jgi:hypothetical protein